MVDNTTWFYYWSVVQKSVFSLLKFFSGNLTPLNYEFISSQVGDQYALENEEELKDRMNFEEQSSYRLQTGG